MLIWIAVAAFSLIGVLSVGVAEADCTTPGDFGAGSGCAPPGSSGSGKAESWPPTSVDWPPQLGSDTGKGGGDGGDKNDGGTKPTPILMPSGEKRPPATTTSTTVTPTPIVTPHS